MQATLQPPKTASFHRWGGAAFVLGNVLFIINKLDEMSRLFLSRPMPDVISGQNLPLILLGQVSLLFGFVAYYQLWSQRVATPGIYALRLFCAGGIVVAVGHVSFMTALFQYLPPAIAPWAEYLFLLVLIGMLLLIPGLVWFGVLALRQPVSARWTWLPLATGLMGFIGFFLLRGEEITATFMVFRTLFALGLIGMGIDLWVDEQASVVLAP